MALEQNLVTFITTYNNGVGKTSRRLFRLLLLILGLEKLLASASRQIIGSIKDRISLLNLMLILSIELNHLCDSVG